MAFIHLMNLFFIIARLLTANKEILINAISDDEPRWQTDGQNKNVCLHLCYSSFTVSHR